MTGATHLVTGAVIYRYGSSNTPYPYLLLLAFLSHFLLDAVPHYELSLNWNFVLAAAALICLCRQGYVLKDYLIIAAGLMGVLADLNWLFGISSSLSSLHSLIHFKHTYPVSPLLLFLELTIALICVYLLLRKPTAASELPEARG